MSRIKVALSQDLAREIKKNNKKKQQIIQVS
jgi:hypothetical protein